MVSQSFTSPRIFLNWGWFTMVRNHRFTLPNCALKLGSITCKANHIYHFNVLFAEKMSTPHPLKCSFLNTYPSENHIFCSCYFISFHLVLFSWPFLGEQKGYMPVFSRLLPAVHEVSPRFQLLFQAPENRKELCKVHPDSKVFCPWTK